MISTSFTAVGQTLWVSVPFGSKFMYAVSGTFDATMLLERTKAPGQYVEVLRTMTASGSGEILSEANDKKPYFYRLRCSVFASGTVVTTITDVLNKTKKYIISAGGQSKVGGTAGFVVAAAANNMLVTCPADVTAGKLVIPIPQLKKGDMIAGLHLIGQIESAGGTVTVDVDLRKMSAAAADVVDASVATMTQLSVVADTAMGETNTMLQGLSEIVDEGESYYLLITATTGSSTDIALQAAALLVVEAK